MLDAFPTRTAPTDSATHTYTHIHIHIHIHKASHRVRITTLG
ncbi:hypothetical protein ACFFGH_05675 [Lysobacter korlensis]|uniref:Uncharacterized protein n=1 Tax=Lysobacter korlensis TaxID=553636 RepID=A0ABV6RKM3_9GAMM